MVHRLLSHYPPMGGTLAVHRLMSVCTPLHVPLLTLPVPWLQGLPLRKRGTCLRQVPSGWVYPGHLAQGLPEEYLWALHCLWSPQGAGSQVRRRD